MSAPRRGVAAVARRHWPVLLLVLPLSAAEVSVEAALALAYRWLVDDALGRGDDRLLATILTVLVIWVGLVALLAVVRDWYYASAVARLTDALREAVFEAGQRMPVSFWQSQSPSAVTTRLATDLGGLEQWLAGAVDDLVLPALSVLTGLGLLFVFLPADLAFLSAVVWPLVLLGPRAIAPRAAAAVYRRRTDEARVLATANDGLAAWRVVKLFALADFVAGRFREARQPLLRSQARATFLGALAERSTVLAISWLQVGAVIFAALLVMRGQLTAGAFVAFLTVFWNLGWSLVVVARAFPSMIAAAGSVRRLDELLATPDDPLERAAGADCPPFREILHLEDISFDYPGRPGTLSKLSMDIRRGEVVAIVGPSGSGKSTLLDLLCGFLAPSSGRILIDGQDLSRLRTASWREQVAVVPQESLLFDLPVGENILLGRPSATADEVIAAAREAGLHECLTNLPDGYRTAAGVQGSRLSVGERQRVCVARALLRRPGLLLLDEPTASLDPASEAILTAAVLRPNPNRAVVLVTHRLATARDADRIYVMEHGRLVEAGRHEELVARDGCYARLWQRQCGIEVSADGSSAAVAVERLRAIPLLQTLSDDQLAVLAGDFEVRRLAAGEAAFAEGDPGEHLYLIARGQVSVSRRLADGSQAEVARLAAGDEFGEVALLTDAPRNATVTARTPCLLLALPRLSFDRLLAAAPLVRERLERLMAERVRTVTQP